MLSLQEISDRLEIQDLLTRYSFAIDQRDWDALDSVFTEDARIDYSESGGAAGSNVAQATREGQDLAVAAYVLRRLLKHRPCFRCPRAQPRKEALDLRRWLACAAV